MIATTPDGLIVGFDVSASTDETVLVFARKMSNGATEILASLRGEAAEYVLSLQRRLAGAENLLKLEAEEAIALGKRLAEAERLILSAEDAIVYASSVLQPSDEADLPAKTALERLDAQILALAPVVCGGIASLVPDAPKESAP